MMSNQPGVAVYANVEDDKPATVAITEAAQLILSLDDDGLNALAMRLATRNGQRADMLADMLIDAVYLAQVKPHGVAP